MDPSELNYMDFRSSEMPESLASDAVTSDGFESPVALKSLSESPATSGQGRYTSKIALVSDINVGLSADAQRQCESSVPDVALSPTGKPASSKSTAAMKVQKVYRSYRTRRMLADSAVVAEELWWQASNYPRLNQITISFFNFLKPEIKWKRIGLNYSGVGKSIVAKAQKLAFQHWVEAIDPRHRYGPSLRMYYEEWCKDDAGQPFFYWLDIGDGKEVELKQCPRSKLRQQCIKYLGPQERDHYEYIVVEGKIMHKQSKWLLNTKGGFNSTKWIFVMSTSKKLYAGEKSKGMFHHSSFLAGGATLAAGRLVARNGTLMVISAYSGHYRTTDDTLDSFLSFLKENGVHLNKCAIHKSDEDYENYEESQSTKYETIAEPSANSESNQSDTLVEVKKDLSSESSEESQSTKYETIAEPTANSESIQSDTLVEVKKDLSSESSEVTQSETKSNYKRTLSGGLQSPRAEVPMKAILHRIYSKRTCSNQLGNQLSLKWSTGAGPRIVCVADYPVELRVQALEFVNLTPRSPPTPSSYRRMAGLASPTTVQPASPTVQPASPTVHPASDLHHEMASASTGMGSKLKSLAFKNYFRTVVTEMVKLGPNQASIYVASPPHIPDGPSRPVCKTRLCSRCYKAERCNFGEKCHFAHDKWELGKPIFLDDHAMPSSDFAGQLRDSRTPSSPDVPFTAKISVDTSLARAIIGNGAVNSNKICLETDVEPLIQVHESDFNLRDIELKGNFEQVKLASAMVIELIESMGKSSVSLATLDIDSERRLMRPSLSEMGKNYLYLVVYICTHEYMYALYRIDINDYLPQTNSSPVLLCEPVLLLGREFPFGMAFFAFGSRIYILGSGGTYRSRNVYAFDTVTGDFGYAHERMLTYKFLPVVIKPLKPFEDRVFVFSRDMCGHDLEVFFPDRRKNSWTFIGGPPWWTYPPGCLVDSHSTVLGGFLLLTSNGVILFYDIPSNTWTFRMDSHTYFILEPRVFAYEMGRWFSYCANEANQDDLVGFLCSYSMESMSMQRAGESPPLHLIYHPPHCKFYCTDNLIYLGNFCICLVRSGFDSPAGDPLPKLHVTVSLLRVDPCASSILGEQSSSYEIDQFSQCDDTSAYVYASFVI